MSKQQVEANIMGQSYVLAAPEHEVADLKQAVAKVDEAMCKIRDAGKIKARERIAVLAALNLAFDARSAQNTAAMTTDEHGLDMAQNDVRLSTLIYKLDQALGRDGHLL